MPDWLTLFRKPDDLGGMEAPTDWLDRIAARLLIGSRLLAGRQPHRLVEIEFYYWSTSHPDPFAHRDPIQSHIGHWYFHRMHGVYRSGSFKGLDLTFGDGDTYGGILIRGMETPEGALIDGPSLCVDYLLKATGAATIAALDRASNKRLAWERGNPLFLRKYDTKDIQPWLRSPRVGLSLTRLRSRVDSTRFIMRPYRCIAEPRRIKKGKPHLVLALYAQGVRAENIQRLTNCPRRTVERYIADFESGREAADFTPYFGSDLGPSAWCQLYGVWIAHWGFFGERR